MTTTKKPGVFGRVAHGTLFYGLGAVAPKLVSFVLLPFYTALLTPDEFGIVDTAGQLTVLLTVMMRLGLPGSVARYYYDFKTPEELADYVTSVGLVTGVSSIVIGAISVVLFTAFPGLVAGVPLVPFLLLAVVASALDSPWEIERRLTQAEEDVKRAARLNVVRTLATLVLTATFVIALRWGAVGMLAAETIVGACFFVHAQRYLHRRFKGRFRWALIPSSLRYGVWVLPSHVIGSVTALTIRAIAASTGSLGAVGYVAVGMKFVQPLVLVQTAFNRAFTPVYFSARSKDDPLETARLANVSEAIWFGALFVYIAAALGGPPVARLLTADRFDEGTELIPLLALTFLGTACITIFGAEIFYAKRTWVSTLSSLLSNVASIGATYAFIERSPAAAMALGLATQAITGAIVSVAFSVSVSPMPQRWWHVFRTTLLAAALLGVAWWATRYVGDLGRMGIATGATLAFPLAAIAIGDRSAKRALELATTKLRRRRAAA